MIRIRSGPTLPDGDIVTFIGKTFSSFKEHFEAVIENFDNIVNDENYPESDIYLENPIIKDLIDFTRSQYFEKNIKKMLPEGTDLTFGQIFEVTFLESLKDNDYVNTIEVKNYITERNIKELNLYQELLKSVTWLF